MTQVSPDLIAQLCHDVVGTITKYKGPIQVLKKVGGALCEDTIATSVKGYVRSPTSLVMSSSARLQQGGKNKCTQFVMMEAIELVCVGADEVPKTPVNGRYFRKFFPDTLLEEIQANYLFVSYRTSF